MEHIRPTERTSIREWIKRYWIAGIMGLLALSFMTFVGVQAYNLTHLTTQYEVKVEQRPRSPLYWKELQPDIIIVAGNKAEAKVVVENQSNKAGDGGKTITAQVMTTIKPDFGTEPGALKVVNNNPPVITIKPGETYILKYTIETTGHTYWKDKFTITVDLAYEDPYAGMMPWPEGDSFK